MGKKKNPKEKEMHLSLKRLLGAKGTDSTSKVRAFWKKRIRSLCKPCWELKYCPYGPLIEQFPLPPPTREEAIEGNENYKKIIATGRLLDGRKLDAERKRSFQRSIKEFRASDFPPNIPDFVEELSCRVFGHVCPVYMVAEPLTETKDLRSTTRNIPREVMLQVVRRDGQICQECNDPVRDDEVEFDHIIPFSKGGSSTTGNIRLIHRSCNRVKSDSLESILHENPIEHLSTWQKQSSKKK